MNNIGIIEKELEGYRSELKYHRLYDQLENLNDIKIFMESHIFAVWDFMSLLKALQIQLTCVQLPWTPARNAKTVRFINEIVMGEESDLNEISEPKSHFEMYLEAMQEIKADTSRILSFIDLLSGLDNISKIIETSPLTQAEKDFLQYTFEVIKSKESHKIAAAFTFGREDLIPDMFLGIINQNHTGTITDFPKLKYYLERHIELDGDEHGPLAMNMIQELCHDDNQAWQDVLDISKKALELRIRLWDDIADRITKHKTEDTLIAR